MSAVPVMAQSAQLAAKAPSTRPVWKAKEVSFRDAKPVVGLPSSRPNPRLDASVDGAVFVSVHDDKQSQKGMDVYSVSLDAEVKQLIRPMPPPGFDIVAEMNSFATEHEYVTLYRVEKHENGNMYQKLTEIRYFLSLAELDGSEGKLLPLDVKFKPLKIAMFNDGSFLLLGL